MTNDELNKVIENLRHCDQHHDCITVYTFENSIEAIEQLRKERDEEREQFSQEQWDSLNQELWDRRTEMTEMKIAIAKLRNERDEARREVCNWSVGVGHKATSQAVADDRGWDCYEKETP